VKAYALGSAVKRLLGLPCIRFAKVAQLRKQMVRKRGSNRLSRLGLFEDNMLRLHI
jgi:hypothetical protein